MALNLDPMSPFESIFNCKVVVPEFNYKPV